MTNLKMNLASVDEKLASRNFYGKVIMNPRDGSHVVRFTSVPAEIDAYFQAHLQYAAKQDAD